jgi:hypothetical protein
MSGYCDNGCLPQEASELAVRVDKDIIDGRGKSVMARYVVRNLGNAVKAKPYRPPDAHDYSEDEQVCAILRDRLREPIRTTGGLGSKIAAHFAGIGMRDGEDIPELCGHARKIVMFE